MRKVGSDIQQVIASIGGNSEEARINMRTQQVRDRYKQALKMVYRESADLHLAHTNNVIITMKGDAKTLIVYVDDSLFAAELNAQRELIKLHLLELFGEDIDDFQIKTSRWKKYRENHPYVIEEAEITNRNIPSIPLSDEERLHVANISARIDDEKIRNTFEKAMTADLEWKKGEKVDNTPKN